MDINDYTDLEIAELIAISLRCEIDVKNGIATYSIKDRAYLLPLRDISDIQASIATKEVSEETTLHSEYSYEILAHVEGPLPFIFRGDNLTLHDPDTQITYEVSVPSDDYLIWLICSANKNGSLRDLVFSPIARERLRRIGEDEGILDALRRVLGNHPTIKIKSTSKTSIKRFHTLSNSLLFHLAYNLDVALVPQRFFAEIFRRGRITRMRRSSRDDIDPPRRTYNEDLVNHYVLGISTDNATVQYLSFYHILEHFFESVFNDELIETIKTAITLPSFSYKRKKDVASLVATIKKNLQIRSETITFSELQALNITLARFMTKQEVVEKLDEYDSSLVDYYRNEQVSFSDGPKIDLNSADTATLIKNLSKRIYQTRNSLVHSKDGDRAKYTPFRDERHLVKEIPLLRFIAESVILKVSELS